MFLAWLVWAIEGSLSSFRYLFLDPAWTTVIMESPLADKTNNSI